MKDDYGFYEETIDLLKGEVVALNDVVETQGKLILEQQQQLNMLKQILSDDTIHSVAQVDIALELLNEIGKETKVW